MSIEMKNLPKFRACYDAMGSYAPALFVFAALMVGNLLVLQFSITKSHRMREAEIPAPSEQ